MDAKTRNDKEEEHSTEPQRCGDRKRQEPWRVVARAEEKLPTRGVECNNRQSSSTPQRFNA